MTIHSGEGVKRFLSYTGPSMNPTLDEADLLEVIPYEERKMSVGDVVGFLPENGQKVIIHRVIQVKGREIHTKGDSNDQLDPWSVESGSILGQVCAAWRGQKRRKVWGGRVGMLWATVCYGLRWVNRRISPRLHRCYRALSERGLLWKWLPERLRPRLLRFRESQQWGYRVMLGRSMIGWYDRGNKAWRIRRPFRLFVDEGQLSDALARLDHA